MLKIILAVILICASGIAQDDKLKIYSGWDACVKSLEAEGDFETGLWPKLRDSLVNDPPELTRSLDREAMIERLIELHEQRLKLLRGMLKAERQ
jgi:hypothetical protein